MVVLCNRAKGGADLHSMESGFPGKYAHRFYHIKNASQVCAWVQSNSFLVVADDSQIFIATVIFFLAKQLNLLAVTSTAENKSYLPPYFGSAPWEKQCGYE